MKHTQLETREDSTRKGLFMLIMAAIALLMMAFSYLPI